MLQGVLRATVVALVGCGRIGFGPAADAGASPRDSGPLTCPTTYAMVGSGCYRVVSVGQAWTSAEASCESDGPGAHLAIPDDATELATIATSVMGPLGVQDAWIGISDRIAAEVYLTVTGSQAFLSWTPGQPDSPTARCVRVVASTGMSDADCGNPDDFVCEFDGAMSDPTAF